MAIDLQRREAPGRRDALGAPNHKRNYRDEKNEHANRYETEGAI